MLSRFSPRLRLGMFSFCNPWAEFRFAASLAASPHYETPTRPPSDPPAPLPPHTSRNTGALPASGCRSRAPPPTTAGRASGTPSPPPAAPRRRRRRLPCARATRTRTGRAPWSRSAGRSGAAPERRRPRRRPRRPTAGRRRRPAHGGTPSCATATARRRRARWTPSPWSGSASRWASWGGCRGAPPCSGAAASLRQRRDVVTTTTVLHVIHYDVHRYHSQFINSAVIK